MTDSESRPRSEDHLRKKLPSSEASLSGDGMAEQPGTNSPPEVIDHGDFRSAYGETLQQTLDLDTWDRGEDLAGLYERLNQEVEQALDQEDSICRQVREVVFEQIVSRPGPPRGAGV